MADLTGILRQTFTVPAQSIKTIDFKDKQPNYFHIQNIGTDVIYFSVHGMPTAAYYDMKIDGGSIGTFTDTYQQPEAYIFNPSTEDVNVIMLSFSAPFDPAVLAQANKQITIGGTIETDGVVKGFQTALPSGSNKIGNVGISGALPTGSNKIGKVEMTGTEFANLAAKVSEIRTKLDSLSFDIGAVTVDEVNIKDDGVQGYFYHMWSNNVDDTLTPPTGYYFSKINSIKYIIENNNPTYPTSIICTPVDKYPNIGYDYGDDGELTLYHSGEYNINSKCKAKSIFINNGAEEQISLYLFAEIKPYKVTTETLTITDWAQLKTGDKIVKALSGSYEASDIQIEYSDFSGGNMTIPGTISLNDGLTITNMTNANDGGTITSVTIERTSYSC